MEATVTELRPYAPYSVRSILLVFVLLASVGCSGNADDVVKPAVFDPLKYDSTLYAMIPAGSFMMGDTSGFASTQEQPIHKVSISRPFLIGRTEVTQAQYSAVMLRNPSRFAGEDHPVENVSWSDAVNYCNALSVLEKLTPCYSDTGIYTVCDWNANGYRLPTEAEWEYACRAGTRTDFYTGQLVHPARYPPDPSLDFAGSYGGNSGGTTRPVGRAKKNAFGLYDMHGNLAEWCWDSHSFQYYAVSPDTDPRGPDADSYRVLRGGSWYQTAIECRSSYRSATQYYRRGQIYGFRVARTYK